MDGVTIRFCVRGCQVTVQKHPLAIIVIDEYVMHETLVLMNQCAITIEIQTCFVIFKSETLRMEAFWQNCIYE